MKTAIITGAGRGIGRAVATALANDGYEVALLARTRNQLDEVQSAINSLGGNAIVCPCDVSVEADVNKVIEDLKKRWNRLDLLFNNAGLYAQGTEELSAEDFRRLYEVNVFGAWHLLHHAVPWLEKVGKGTIINLASVAGNTGFAGVGAYCSTKFALRGLNESLHHQLEPKGIRVTAISPSWVNTAIAAKSPVPPDNMIQPEDIAQCVRYILSLSDNISLKEIILGCRADLAN